MSRLAINFSSLQRIRLDEDFLLLEKMDVGRRCLLNVKKKKFPSLLAGAQCILDMSENADKMGVFN